jgi:hypothetical protein
MHWLAHWLGLDNAAGPVYLFFSGSGSDLGLYASAIAIAFHAVASYRHKNCHVHRCPRLGRFPVEGTAWSVCRRHHPSGAPTYEQVIAAHKTARRVPAAERTPGTDWRPIRRQEQ